MAVKACDVGSIDMMVAEAESLLEYRHAATAGSASPAARASAAAPVKWTRDSRRAARARRDQPCLARRPAGTSQPSCRCRSRCATRAFIRRSSTPASSGRLAWKGRDAARLSLALYALPPAPPEPGLAAPGIGAETPFDAQTVSIASCGLRDAGAPFGDADDAAAGLSGDAVPDRSSASRPGRAMAWPAPRRGRSARRRRPARSRPTAGRPTPAPGSAPGSACTTAFRQRMERLYNEWSRALEGGRRAARGRGLAAGRPGRPRPGAGGRTSPATVAMRIAGALDLLALSLDLRLSGELVDGGAARAASSSTARGAASCA